MAETSPNEILDFWFDRSGPKAWFSGEPAFDARVRRLFGPFVHSLHAARNLGDYWLEGPDSALALIIALDQFPRHIWRGTPRAFSLDGKALSAATAAVGAGFDWAVEPQRRAFFYMPFMHSEFLPDQERCVALCESRLGEDSDTTRHARAHRDVIARFWRFPHRNAVLGRANTPGEKEFLDGGGYAPGVKRPAK